MNRLNKNCLKIEEEKPVPMEMPEDDEREYIDDQGEDCAEEPEKPEKKVKSNSFFINFIGGDLLSKEGVMRQFPFLLYLVLLAMLYITNTYIAEDMSRDIARTNRLLEDRHVEYVYLKSEITNMTKQTVLVRKLKNKGIKESIEPLKKIVVKEEGDKK